MTTAADPQALLLELLDPSNRANPYPAYAQIRERGPLQLPNLTLNVFSSFADCDDVLRHPSSPSDRIKSTAAQRQIDPLARRRHTVDDRQVVFLHRAPGHRPRQPCVHLGALGDHPILGRRLTEHVHAFRLHHRQTL